MSSESEKPFVCTFPDCNQTFTNHDHLLAHAQRHEFSLKFRAGENLLIDQTPTPTRFLRNCEESGLFQELETNPFDHDFKTATNSDGKEDAAKPSEDATTETQTEVTTSEETPAVTVATITVPTTIPVAPPPNLANPDRPVPMATAPAHISTATALTKQKLLQNIQLKEQQKLLELQVVQQLGQSSPEILVQALKNITPVSDGEITLESSQSIGDMVTFVTPSVTPEQVRRKRGRRPDDESPEIKRQRFLERNRAAASRCRAKKKQWVDSLENKSKDLETANQSLLQEVVMLRSEVQQLKSILIAHKDCPLIVHQTAASTKSTDSGEGAEQPTELRTGVTLLSQLASMPSMSPLITSPVPSVGSVVPNITPSHPPPSALSPPTTTIVITTNGMTQQQTPEVGKDIEISADQ